MSDMQYGRKRTITVDSDGNKNETITYYKGGKVMPESREVIEERKRVNNQLEEAAEYHSFSKRYHQDPTMLTPSITIEGKGQKDFYYVVLTYTRIIR